MDVLEFRRRRVELDGGRGAGSATIERDEAGTAHPGVDFGQPQQGIENADHAVDVRDRAIDFGEGLLRRGPDQRELLEARAQLRERRAQIMGDGVGDVAHAVHQQFDLIEHAVDGARQAY